MQIQKYLAKISGPLLDRIDIHIEVKAVKVAELSQKRPGEPSDAIRARVICARERQAKRFNKRTGLFSNADMQSREIHEFCMIDSDGEALLKMAMTKLALSVRAYDRMLNVAQTMFNVVLCLNRSLIPPLRHLVHFLAHS
jgi:magnesium chelatase family protein